MKIKSLKSLIPVLLAVTCLSGCNEPVDIVATYYDGIDLVDGFGQFLVEDLHALMWRTHTRQVRYSSWSSYETRTYKDKEKTKVDHESIDWLPSTSKYNESFYTHKQISFKAGTREHVWPCANSDQLWQHQGTAVASTGDPGGGSDLYHVRPCNSDINTARGNSKFVDFDDFPALKSEVVKIAYDGENAKIKPIYCHGGAVNGNTGKYEYASKTEVDDTMKGDVARILCYVWLHYQRTGTTPAEHKSQTGSLSFKNVLGYETDEKCRQKLVEWNELDPVSPVEKNRNDTVQKIQGNRNPFVDHPEIMANVLGVSLDEE